MSVDPLRGPVATNADTCAESDTEVLGVPEDSAISTVAPTWDDRAVLAVVTAFGLPAVVSSGAVVAAQFADPGCDPALITPRDRADSVVAALVEALGDKAGQVIAHPDGLVVATAPAAAPGA